ncbi:SGE1 [Moesziomyces antarcticus]|nr:SGE1 [Moesziomyces antarcticus]GAK62708.1 SGE1 [Moesziomyces antarcticus]
MTIPTSVQATEHGGPRVSSMSSIKHSDNKEVEKKTASVTAQGEGELSKLKILSILIMMGLLMFLVALDKTIIGVALPSISNEFHSLKDIGWYGSAYMATNAALQLVWGRVYKSNPVKPIFLAAVVIFETGSAICGAAPNSKALIVGRAIAGAGGAGITNGVISIVMAVVPLEKRATVQAAMGSVFGVASAMGPLLGGALTENVSWRWCFYINLPFAVVALVPVIFFLDGSKTADKGKKMLPFLEQIRQIDPLGALLILGSIVCLVLALQWGGQASSTTDLSSWNTPRVIALLVVFGVTLLAFVAWQMYMQDRALLPPSIFVERSVLGSFWYMWFFAGSMTVIFYYVPVWFQVVQGVAPIQSSYRTLATIVPFVVASILGGVVTKKTGYYTPPMLLPPVLGAVGLGLISTWGPNASRAAWAGYQVMYGIGMGAAMTGSSLAVQAALPHSEVPIAIGAVFFAREMGSAVFVATAENLLSSQLVKGLQQVAELRDGSVQLAQSGPSQIRSAAQSLGDGVLEEVIRIFNAALRHVWYLALALTLATVVPFFLIRWLNVNEVAKERAAEREAAKVEVQKVAEA